MIIEAAKKDSGSGGGGTESPNTLRSTTIVDLIKALGEGPIVGLMNGAKSILVDGTPLMNIDGTLNRKGVTWDQRYGTPGQAHFLTNTRTGTPHDVSAQVKVATGRVIRTITETAASMVQVVVQIPALAQQITEGDNAGDTVGASVSYVVERRASGGAWVPIETVNITNQKNLSPYFRKSIVPRPEGNEIWDIGITRLTPDSADVKLQNDTHWGSYITLVKGKYSYDDTALINLRIDSQEYGSSLGDFSFHVRGLIIDTPSNYNPTTRAYTGVWDGTFIKQWTNNPAWVFWDVLTNNRYGLGEFIDQALADKWSLYAIAQYCDQLVPSGFKNTLGADIMEPRFTFNGVINTREEAYKVLQSITTSFRAMAYWSMSQVFASCDMPADPVLALSPANVVGGAFGYSGTSIKARHSVAMISWNDPQALYQQAIEVVQDDDQMNKFGWRQIDVTLTGCTARGQAHRFGKWILDTEKSETETVQFNMSWDGYVLENNLSLKPGDIVLIADPRKNGGFRSGGRYAAINSTSEVVLDAPFEAEIGETYTIGGLLPSGKFETRPVTAFSLDNKTVTVSPAFTEAPLVNADWVIQGTNMAARRYRIMAVQETDTNLFKVTALFNDPTKYARIENGVTLQPVPYVRPRNVISQVTNLAATEQRYFQNGVSHSRVTLSWTAPNDFLIKDFTVTADSPRGFVNLGATPTPNIDFNDAVAGAWTFYVSARSMTGAVSVPVAFAFAVEGWQAVDGPIPNNLQTTDGGATFAGRSATLGWTNVFPPNSVLFAVENVVRVYDTSSNLLRTENVFQNSYTYDYEKNVNDGGPRRSVRIDVTAKNVTGAESAPASITISNPVPAVVIPVLDADVGSIDVSWINNDNDYAGALVWTSKNSGFVPTLANRNYDGPDTSTVVFVDAGTWYVWVALYDSFGKDGLNISPPQSLAVNDITSALADVVPSLIEAAGQVTTSQLNTEMETVADQIAGILSQMVQDRDQEDTLYQRSVQELSVQTGDVRASVMREEVARIGADYAEATARLALQVSINTTIVAQIVSEQLARVTADVALTSQIDLAMSQIAGNSASIVTEATTRATADSAQSSLYTTLSSTVGTNQAQLTTVATSVDGIKLEYGVIGTIDGVTGGFLFTGIKKLDGSISYTLKIAGNVIVDGSITAAKLNVTNLAAINANLGTVTAGIIQSSNGKVVWNLNSATLIVSD